MRGEERILKFVRHRHPPFPGMGRARFFAYLAIMPGARQKADISFFDHPALEIGRQLRRQRPHLCDLCQQGLFMAYQDLSHSGIAARFTQGVRIPR
jgi:hypothetical protein